MVCYEYMRLCDFYAIRDSEDFDHFFKLMNHLSPSTGRNACVLLLSKVRDTARVLNSRHGQKRHFLSLMLSFFVPCVLDSSLRSSKWLCDSAIE